jgi:4-amino-4-deoxy-L-arabinose transferase-like glycosyltransferase
MRLILLVCLALRLVLFFAASPWSTSVRDGILLRADGKEYDAIARTMLAGNDFSAGEDFKGLRTPVYPIYVAAIYWLAGPRPWVVVLINVFIDSFSCWLLFLSLTNLFGVRAGRIAALFYALDPALISYSVTMFCDTVFVFTLILFLYNFSRFIKDQFRSPGSKYVIFSAMFLGLATLTKPIAIGLPILVVPTLFFLSKGRTWALRSAALFLVVFFVILSPWMTRNYSRYGHFALSNSGDFNTLEVYVSHMEMARRHSNQLNNTIDELEAEADSLIRHDGFDPAAINPFDKAAYYRRLAMTYINKYPVLFAKHTMLGVSHEVFGLGTNNYSDLLGFKNAPKSFTVFAYSSIAESVQAFFKEKTYPEIMLGFAIVLYLAVAYSCTLYGVFISFRYNKVYTIFCLLIILYFLIVPGPGGWVRYKLPAIPFYLGFAGQGWKNIFRSFDS